MDSSICRACTEQSSFALVPIFSKLEDQFIANVIADSCSISIIEDDGLPTGVCVDCMKTVEVIVHFARKVRESDQKLRKRFKEDDDGDQNQPIDPNAIKFEVFEAEEAVLVQPPKDQLESDTSSSDSESDRDFESDGDDSDWKQEGKQSDQSSNGREKVADTRKARNISDLDGVEKKPVKRRRKFRIPNKSKVKTDGGNADLDSELDEVEQETYVLLSIDPSKFICCCCFKDFDTEKELKEHGKEKHAYKRGGVRPRRTDRVKNFMCDVCYCKYTLEDALKYHQEMSAKLATQKIYECKRCSGRFLSVKKRRTHAHNHPKYENEAPAVKGPAICCKCLQKFDTEEELLEHGQKDHIGDKMTVPDPSKPYECPVCFKRYDHKKSVVRHQRRVYYPEKQPNFLPCSFCGKECSSIKALKSHERIHNDARPFACELCGKRFREKQLLKGHMEYVHTDVKRFLCTICGNYYKTQSSLMTHKLTHNDTPLKCEVCEKTFKTKNRIQIHMRTHTGEKPYQCQYCNMSFADHTNRKRHESSHTGVKPYKCSYCDKTFLVNRFRREHESTHTGVKPYQCDMCEASFNQKPALKKHQQTMHPSSSSDCQPTTLVTQSIE